MSRYKWPSLAEADEHEDDARGRGRFTSRRRLDFDPDGVRCRHAIRGGLLALRAGGSVTLAQRPMGAQYELSVLVEEYVPRLAARAGWPKWAGVLYLKGQSPFHAAVSRCYFDLLVRGRAA